MQEVVWLTAPCALFTKCNHGRLCYNKNDVFLHLQPLYRKTTTDNKALHKRFGLILKHDFGTKVGKHDASTSSRSSTHFKLHLTG